MSTYNAQGTTIAREDAPGTDVFTTIPQVSSISGIGQSRPLIDVSNLNSLAREYKKGLADGQEINLAIQYDPDDATHAALRADMKAEPAVNFEITLTDTNPAQLISFAAMVIDWTLGEVGVDGVYTANVTLKPTGDITYAFAFDYYVDSVNGSDGNTGTTRAQAFASLGGLPTIADYMTIGWKRGSVFRETFTGAAHIEVGDYGTLSDPRPIVTGYNLIGSGDWTDNANLTFSFTGTFEDGGIPGGGHQVHVQKNGVYLKEVGSVAAVIAEAGTYFVTNDTAGTTSSLITIRNLDDSNPTSDGQTYEYTARPSCLADGGSGMDFQTFKGIHFRDALTDDGCVAMGSTYGHLWDDCLMEGGSNHTMVMGPCTVRNSTVLAGYFGGNNSNCVTIFTGQTGAEGLASLFDNVTFNRDHDGHGEVWTHMFSHTTGGVTLGQIRYEDCNIPAGTGSLLCGGGSVANCPSFYVLRGSFVAARGFGRGSVVGGELVLDATQIITPSGYQTSYAYSVLAGTGGAAGTVHIKNGTKICSDHGGSADTGNMFRFDGANVDWIIEDSFLHFVLTIDFKGAAFIEAATATGSTVIFRRNEISATPGFTVNRVINFDATVTITECNNNSYSSNCNRWRYAGLNYDNSTTWLALGLYDLDSSMTGGDASSACA